MAAENPIVTDGKDPEVFGVFQRPLPVETVFGPSTTEPISKPKEVKRDEKFTPQPPHDDFPV